jgi:hypothetical protein
MAQLNKILQICSIEADNHEDFQKKLIDQGHDLSFKDENDLLLIHHNQFGNSELKLNDLEKECRNIILDKKLNPLCYSYNEIVYNPDDLSMINFENAIVQESMEGTTLMCFNHNDKWYISTRRCIDASTSVWIQNMSYMTLFIDVLTRQIKNPTDEDKKNKLDEFFSKLDKNNYYFFALIHPTNKNIVNYERHPLLYDNTKCLIHYMTRKLGTTEEVYDDINMDGIIKSLEYGNCDMKKVIDIMKSMNNNNIIYDNIINEGLVIRYYSEDGLCNVVKLQTEQYKKIRDIKPNNSNEHQLYLDLFKNDHLPDYLSMCTNKSFTVKGKIIKRLNETFINLANEILILYYKTRNKNNPEVYNSLTTNYKNLLFKIHGKYLIKVQENMATKIVISDVYNLLKKELTTNELCNLLKSRKKMLDDEKRIYAKRNTSIDITTSLI